MRDLQTILRFHKNKYTVNKKLKSHVNEHSDLRPFSKWLQYYLLEDMNFLLFRKISTNATAEFGNRYFSTNRYFFYWHEFFETFAGSCFRVTFIFGSENHKFHDISFLCFSFSSSFFLWLYGVFEIRESTIKNSMMRSMFCYAAGLRRWGGFFFIFLEFPESIISRATMNDCFFFFHWILQSLFFFFEAIYRSLVLCKKLLLILKYYLKYVNFIKNKSMRL